MKVCFLSWHFATPKILLDSLLKMTTKCSGKWKDMEAVLDPFQADFCVIIDGYSGAFPEDRAIYVGEHPRILGETNLSPAFRKWEDRKALLKLNLDDNMNPGEWWIKYDYDTLVSLPIPKKDNTFCCIMTYQTHNKMYAQRYIFMQEFCKRYPGVVDIYGRPEEKFRNDSILKEYYKGVLGFNKPDGRLGEHLIGKEIVSNYKYSLEFDVGPTQNYFSERFYDALLLWTKPIYFGSNNVHNFIPQKAFHYVDINDLENAPGKIFVDINEEIDYNAISEARDLLLNKYQMWPYIYEKIKKL